MFKKKRKLEVGKHKFCPVCGAKLNLQDGFCTRCGYSFVERQKKNKKNKIKWRNVIIIIAVLLLIYVGIRYSNNQSIIPESLKNALNFLIPKKS